MLEGKGVLSHWIIVSVLVFLYCILFRRKFTDISLGGQHGHRLVYNGSSHYVLDNEKDNINKYNWPL